MENRKEVISNHSFNFRKLARSRSGYLKLSIYANRGKKKFSPRVSLIDHGPLVAFRHRQKEKEEFVPGSVGPRRNRKLVYRTPLDSPAFTLYPSSV